MRKKISKPWIVSRLLVAGSIMAVVVLGVVGERLSAQKQEVIARPQHTRAASERRDTMQLCADSIELARPDSLDKRDTTAVRYIMRTAGRDTTLLIPKAMRFRIAKDMPYLLTVVNGKIIRFKQNCSQPRLQSY